MGVIAGLKHVWQALDAMGEMAGVGRMTPPPAAPTTAPKSVTGAASTKTVGGSGKVEDYTIVGPSTISLRVFRDALLHHSSPAIVDLENTHITLDLADELYDVAVAWGVNPAVALAFFVHESSMGTEGYAKQTKNWGNLRAGPAEMKNDGRFAYYSSWLVGLDDFCRLLTGPLYVKGGLDTVSKVTPRYAPSADANDPAQYAKAVNEQVAIWEAMR